jgi:hypothetical protein
MQSVRQAASTTMTAVVKEVDAINPKSAWANERATVSIITLFCLVGEQPTGAHQRAEDGREDQACHAESL